MYYARVQQTAMVYLSFTNVKSVRCPACVLDGLVICRRMAEGIQWLWIPTVVFICIHKSTVHEWVGQSKSSVNQRPKVFFNYRPGRSVFNQLSWRSPINVEGSLDDMIYPNIDYIQKNLEKALQLQMKRANPGRLPRYPFM